MSDLFDRIVGYSTPDVDCIAQHIAAKKAIAFADIRFILAAVAYVCQKNISGDIIELGCASGDTSVGLRTVLDICNSNKTLHVCDSFLGLPAPTDNDKEPTFNAVDFREGVFKLAPDAVLTTFAEAGVKPPIIHQGWFSEITDYPDVLAFAFVDGDLYQSIWDGLTVVYPRMSPGGIIVIHDYQYPPLPGARKAVDEFFADKLEEVMPYADSAVIVKGA